MLDLVTAPRATTLAAHLAGILAPPPADPFAAEWVAVPSPGMNRWLRLELARHLGARRAGDGVVANVEMPFPSALVRRVLDADLESSVLEAPAPGHPPLDPWRVDHLVWAVLDVVRNRAPASLPTSLVALPDGASRIGQARRLAELFDRYASHRPEMVMAWSRGEAIDAVGAPLAASNRWQFELWTELRRAIDAPSIPERLPRLIAQVADGTLEVDLPDRLAIFGLTAIPGGSAFLEVAEALSHHRAVHVLMLDPSPAAGRKVWNRTGHQRLRNDDDTRGVIVHPLLASWGTTRREATVQLAEAQWPEPVVLDADDDDDAPTTLLARIQRDIRTDASPGGDHRLAADDRSIQIHACHGPTRQLEVARNAILDLLAADPTLDERDVVVVSPNIARFSPLVEAAFGPAADGPDHRSHSLADGVAHRGAPPLRWHVLDRSIRSAHPLLDATAALLDLVGGRFEAGAVLEFASLAPVRHRFGFTEDALATLGSWTSDANLRWGLDAAHRARWGLPASFEANSWRAGLDQLLTGAALADDDPTFGPGGVVALGVEGSDVGVLGSLADLIARLDALHQQCHGARPVGEWVDLLDEVLPTLFGVDVREAWQWTRLREVLADIALHARTTEGPSAVPLSLADLKRLLDEPLSGVPRRSAYLDGSLAIASLQPLRSVPHRIVCIVGFDDVGSGSATAHGDDLVGLHPMVGDRDPRADARQALLEAVMSAGSHLIVTRTGHDVRTNQQVPLSVALSELVDTIDATVDPEGSAADDPPVWGRLVHHHGRHDFDPPPSPEPWTFDPLAVDAAIARRRRQPAATVVPAAAPLAGATAPAIGLADLHGTALHPVRSFYRDRLGIDLPRTADAEDDSLPVELSALDEWSLGTDLLDTVARGLPAARWRMLAEARGVVAPGVLGHRSLDGVTAEVDELIEVAGAHPGLLDATGHHLIDVVVEGTRIVGTVGRCTARGPVRVSYSKQGPKLTLGLWIDLLALTLAEPTTRWVATGLCRGDKEPALSHLTVAGPDAEARQRNATSALAVLVDLHQRSQREPIPLFVKTSHALATGADPGKTWWNYNFPGEGEDPYHRLAFGPISWTDLQALPCEPHDPAGPTVGRALRYASTLWDAYDASCIDLAEDGQP